MAMDMIHPLRTPSLRVGSVGGLQIVVSNDHGRTLLCVETVDRLGRPGSTFLCGPASKSQYEPMIGMGEAALIYAVSNVLLNAGVGEAFYVYFSPEGRAVSMDYLSQARLIDVLDTIRPYVETTIVVGPSEAEDMPSQEAAPQEELSQEVRRGRRSSKKT